jgi:hypothetical protein
LFLLALHPSLLLFPVSDRAGSACVRVSN